MKRTVALLILILLAGCSQQDKKGNHTDRLPFYNTADFTPEWLTASSTGYSNTHTIPAFSFVDQNGETVSEKTFAGKIYVADFFFTSCPGICKKLTNNLTIVQKEFSGDDKILLLSHSVTPDEDNVERLKKYAVNNGVIDHKWHLVTGNKAEIYSIARQAYFADEDLGLKKDANDFLHTENILLIDKAKRIRGVYKGTSELQIRDLIADIKTLEKEE